MIKNIIFDVGNVLLSYRWKYVFQKAGLNDEESDYVFEKIFGSQMWIDLDAGLYDHWQTTERLKEAIPKHAKAVEYFMNHPELMALPREKVWELVHQIKETGYELYILSNYSKVLFDTHTKDRPFWNDIPKENAVVSYEINKIKPNPDIYEYILNKFSLKADECIFFDDNLSNIKAAEAAGINAIHVPTEELLIEELNKLINC